MAVRPRVWPPSEGCQRRGRGPPKGRAAAAPEQTEGPAGAAPEQMESGRPVAARAPTPPKRRPRAAATARFRVAGAAHPAGSPLDAPGAECAGPPGDRWFFSSSLTWGIRTCGGSGLVTPPIG
ncbi:hypothetical protein HEK131_31640 [Streptomyces seoulensis]|nr:hypothetical protein HEK131_31640 [Streptomyces seoulensis]